MAWNHYYIFVKGPAFNDLEGILHRLNLDAYKPGEETNLTWTNKPTTLFAGVYEGNLIIVHQELVFKFFGPTQTQEERCFIEAFPGAEIAVLIINESVGLFGFSLIQDGKKVRMKDGADGAYYNDVGEPLPEEQEILSGDIFRSEDLEYMREDGMSEEEVLAMIQFEASYRVPNRLTARYLGEPVLTIDPEKVKLIRYEQRAL